MIRMIFLMGFFLISVAVCDAGPYSPHAPSSGSIGISADDPRMVEWASGITVVRGLMQIDKPSLGYASFGTPELALGSASAQSKATTNCVSLGQGGTATLTFDQPIVDAPGYDFAVFGNGFSSGALEWCKPAFVEVSSDGEHFVRFPAVSLTPTTTQVGSFGMLDPTNLNNLAGKDPAGWGTPFDLSELAVIAPQLQLNAITHVRLTDCVGSIDPKYASYDSLGNIVNAPWPTPFASSGFCLSGVGVIHAVPEPGSLLLLTLAGAISFFVFRRKSFF